MAEPSVPLVALDPAGKAPIISYNVPDPVSYPLTHLLELRVPDGLLVVLPAPQPPPVEPEGELRKALGLGVFRDDVFPHAVSRKTSLALIDTDFVKQLGAQQAGVAAAAPLVAASTDLVRLGTEAPVARSVTKLPVVAIAEEIARGKRFSIRRNLYGTSVAELLQPVAPRPPRLMIVERYRLSSFLGQYGAGRTLNTFTLLPGERTKITIKSYTRTESEAQRASSILDSFSETSASEFESALETEQSDRSKHDDSLAFEASMEGQYGVAFATHASAKAGVKTSSSNAREHFARSVQNATSKHAQSASAKRDVKVDTSNKQKTEAGSEQVIEREIANINVGRTLNFVFRQMLQEFVTVTHLVDVRVAYWDGHVQNKREVPLHQLDELLAEVADEATTPGAAAQLRQLVLDAVERVVDHRGETRTFVEAHQPFADEPAYLRVVPGLASRYEDETGNAFTVPGIITRAQKLTLRTEGVIVEALLGQGNALDPYSMALQDEAVRARTLENAAKEDEAARALLARTIVQSGTAAQADAFRAVFWPPPAEAADA